MRRGPTYWWRSGYRPAGDGRRRPGPRSKKGVSEIGARVQNCFAGNARYTLLGCFIIYRLAILANPGHSNSRK